MSGWEERDVILADNGPLSLKPETAPGLSSRR
jgi:hypothetical protein